MKEIVHIAFSIPLEHTEEMQAVLTSLSCASGFRPIGGYWVRAGFEYEFESGDPELHIVRNAIEQRNLTHRENFLRRYTDDDLREFPFLCMTPYYDTSDIRGQATGVRYDLSQACPRCGTGAIQVGPFLLPKGKLPKKKLLFWSAGFDVFVAEPLAEAFRNGSIEGVELRQTVDVKDSKLLPWWQVVYLQEMPRMSIKTTGVTQEKNACPECRRNWHSGSTVYHMEIFYDRADVGPEQLPDIVATWERFGASGLVSDDGKRGRYAPPMPLIRPRVFDIFRDFKLKDLEFYPVRMID